MNQIQSKRTKKCPYCNVPLSLNANEWFSCKKKVGNINRHGIAERPTNYWSYALCLVAWVGFYLYMRWAFF